MIDDYIHKLMQVLISCFIVHQQLIIYIRCGLPQGEVTHFCSITPNVKTIILW